MSPSSGRIKNWIQWRRIRSRAFKVEPGNWKNAGIVKNNVDFYIFDFSNSTTSVYSLRLLECYQVKKGSSELKTRPTMDVLRVENSHNELEHRRLYTKPCRLTMPRYMPCTQSERQVGWLLRRFGHFFRVVDAPTCSVSALELPKRLCSRKKQKIENLKIDIIFYIFAIPGSTLRVHVRNIVPAHVVHLILKYENMDIANYRFLLFWTPKTTHQQFVWRVRASRTL